MALIGPELVAMVAEAIQPLDTDSTRDRYRTGDFPRADATKDRDKRYRWDLWWNIPSTIRYAVTDAVPEACDAHLDTMLRKIVPAL